MLRVCFAALLIAGCTTAAEVDLTVDTTGLGASAASVRNLEVTVDEDHFGHQITLDRPLRDEERIVYKTRRSGSLTFTLHARGGTNEVLGCDSKQIDASAAHVTLRPVAGGCMQPGDGGVVTASSCDNLGAHPEWLLCDGFDGTTVDSAWGVDVTNGAVTIDDSILKRGTGAVHFHFDAAASFMDLGSDYEVARLYRAVSHAGSLFARVFVKLPGATVNHTTNNSTVMKMIHDSGDSTGILLTWSAGSELAVLRTDGSFHRSGGSLSPSDWTCLEWQLPTTQGDVHVWTDDAEVTALAGSGLSFPFQLGLLILGADSNVFAGQTADVWMDDLVVSTSRVGCAN